MKSRIRMLSEDTINKIAAGEVIENPASVVKELVENALDANAKDITIEIREGGRQLIRISDNGHGMNGDDALLCLERHATSKLKAVNDLDEIATMGFRGEAVPSIASISKFTLLTRPNEDSTEEHPGTMVIVDGGKIVKCCPVECSKGTTIEVKSLFFNVPVRRKFQKSPAYDAAEIARVVTCLALAHPEIKFHLISDQKSILSTPAHPTTQFQELLKERIHHTLGKEYVDGLCPIDISEGEYHLRGFIGIPGNVKQNRSGQYLFINRRSIASPLVNFAVRDGYGTMLAVGKHPAYVLHLRIEGGLVDVNVHPQKREVRIRQEQRLKELIIRSVNEALRKCKFDMPEEFVSPSVASSPYTIKEFPKFSETFYSPLEPAFHPSIDIKEHHVDLPKERYQTFEPLKPFVFPEIVPVEESPQLLPIEKNVKAIPKVHATVQGYIIALLPQNENTQTSNRLCIVDQRAAHERIIYEKLLLQNSDSSELQSLLVPYTFDLSSADAGFLREQIPQLQKSGIHIKEFGPRTFIIDALPHFFGNVDVEKICEDIIANLHDQNAITSVGQERHKRIAASASRSATSSSRTLTIGEAQGIIDQLFNCETPNLSPTGKLTIAQLSSKQIAALFL